MTFAVSQDVYCGPLEVLLELVEQKKIDISEVSLRAVAGEYLAYIERNRVHSEDIADFLTVAARLVEVKSRTLLPALGGDTDAQEIPLEDQLRAYRVVRTMMRVLGAKMETCTLYTRPPERSRVNMFQAVCPSNLSREHIHHVYNDVLKHLAPFLALRKVQIIKTQSVAECIRHIKKILERQREMHWSDAVAEAKQAADLVVSFLALLDIYREGALYVEQQQPFADMTISYAKPS